MQYLDQQVIKTMYASLPAKYKQARQFFGKPLTLTEKILAAHFAGWPSCARTWSNLCHA